MKLTRKHIGGFFDVRGGDESWVYQLVGIKNGKLLFRVFTNSYKYETDFVHQHDWRVFKSCIPHGTELKQAWKVAR